MPKEYGLLSGRIPSSPYPTKLILFHHLCGSTSTLININKFNMAVRGYAPCYPHPKIGCGIIPHQKQFDSRTAQPRRSLHADAIEVWSAVRGRSVGKSRGASRAEKIAGDTGKGGRSKQVGAALEIIRPRVHALPRHFHTDEIGSDGCLHHREKGRRIGRVSAGDPLLPVVHAVAVGVHKIRRAVGGQAVILQPREGKHRSRRLIFVSAHVHRAADDARVAVEIGAVGHPSVVAGVDDGRIGRGMIIAAETHERRRIGDVRPTAGRQW